MSNWAKDALARSVERNKKYTIKAISEEEQDAPLFPSKDTPHWQPKASNVGDLNMAITGEGLEYQNNAYLDSAAKGFKSGLAQSGAGLIGMAQAVNALMPNEGMGSIDPTRLDVPLMFGGATRIAESDQAKETKKWLDNVTEQNKRTRDWTGEQILNDPIAYATDESGLVYDLGNQGGFMATTAPIGGFGGGLVKGALGLMGRNIGTKGTMALTGAVSGLPEAGIEGGAVYNELVAQGMPPEQAATLAVEVATKNIPLSVVVNAIQAGRVGKALEKAQRPTSGSRIVNATKAGLIGGAIGSTTGAAEEVLQEGVSGQAKGDTVWDIYTPSTWGNRLSDEQLTAAIIGGITGGAMTGGPGAIGGLFRKPSTGQTENIQTPVEDTQTVNDVEETPAADQSAAEQKPIQPDNILTSFIRNMAVDGAVPVEVSDVFTDMFEKRDTESKLKNPEQAAKFVQENYTDAFEQYKQERQQETVNKKVQQEDDTVLDDSEVTSSQAMSAQQEDVNTQDVVKNPVEEKQTQDVVSPQSEQKANMPPATTGPITGMVSKARQEDRPRVSLQSRNGVLTRTKPASEVPSLVNMARKALAGDSNALELFNKLQPNAQTALKRVVLGRTQEVKANAENQITDQTQVGQNNRAEDQNEYAELKQNQQAEEVRKPKFKEALGEYVTDDYQEQSDTVHNYIKDDTEHDGESIYRSITDNNDGTFTVETETSYNGKKARATFNSLEDAERYVETGKRPKKASANSSSTDSSTVQKKEQPSKTPQKQVTFSDNAEEMFASALGLKKKEQAIKIVDDSDAALEAALRDLQDELNKISANPVFNPDLHKAAFKVGMIYLQRGANRFADWSQQMIGAIGEKIRPWLGSVWKSIEVYPKDKKLDSDLMSKAVDFAGKKYTEGFTSAEEIYQYMVDQYGEENVREFKHLIESAFAGINELYNPTIEAEQTTKDTSEPRFSEEETLFDDFLKYAFPNHDRVSVVNSILDRLKQEQNDRIIGLAESLRKEVKKGVDIIVPNDGEGKGYRQSNNEQWYIDLLKEYGADTWSKIKKGDREYSLLRIARDMLLNGDGQYEGDPTYIELEDTINGIEAYKQRLDRNADNGRSTSGKVDIREEDYRQAKDFGSIIGGDPTTAKNGFESWAERYVDEKLADDRKTAAKKAAETRKRNINNQQEEENEDAVYASEERTTTDSTDTTTDEIRGTAVESRSAQRVGERGRQAESQGDRYVREDGVLGSRDTSVRASDVGTSKSESSESGAADTGSVRLSRSVVDSYSGGPRPNGEATGRTPQPAPNRQTDETIKNKPDKSQKAGDLQSVANDLPFLLDGQKDDVVFAENRLLNEKKTGVLFTNGTGTGKTFSGLGIAKRFYQAGKKNILVVTPNAKIIEQWIDTAKKFFGIDMHSLESTRDAGKGAVITTYSNLGDNDALVKRDWDLIIADESHNLMNNEKGDTTAALQKLRSLTLHKKGLHARSIALVATPEEIEAKKARDVLEKYVNQVKKNKEQPEDYVVTANGLEEKSAMSNPPAESLLTQYKEARERYEDLYRLGDEERQALVKEWEGMDSGDKPKTVFLSATPFAYDKDVDYAEGYLFDYPESRGSGYNSGSPRDQFMMQNFGYRMRYNKLTRPETTVDNRVMEIQFHERLRKDGALSGRQLDIDMNYNRGFLLVNQGIGKKIDEGFEWLYENRKKYRVLYEVLRKQFDGRTRNYLLESIKAREAIPLIKQYLQNGKKVVLFHDAKKERMLRHPFRIEGEMKGAEVELLLQAKDEWAVFAKERSDLVKLNLSGLKSPIEILSEAFGDNLLLFNGDVSAKIRNKNVSDFNNDSSGKNLILVQSDAGNSGISLHDTTGKFPRVLINLGIPRRPSYAIQIEGRIYRQGSASNAIIRYLSTGTNIEKQLFASTIAGRASTAENLALGNQARGLRDSFVSAFEETLDGTWETRKPGETGEDIGGKEADRAVQSMLSEFDRAKSFYYAQQKKTAKNKAADGVDYFPTPEPIGFKMVEWAGLKDGDKVLEPSAGHGAISRFFSPNTENVLIEPSRKLAPIAEMNTDGAKVINSVFEDYHIINKFDAVVMNPPYGTGGKTAMEHLAKAFKHLYDNGRVIAIIPQGNSMAKRFEKWFESDEAKHAYLVGEVILPSGAFSRSGTGVATKIVILDKHISKEQVNMPPSKIIDLSSANTVEELFDRIENISMPNRFSQEDVQAERSVAEVVATETEVSENAFDESLFDMAPFVHTKTGEELVKVRVKPNVDRDVYKKVASIAKDKSGIYSRFAKGFLFENEAQAHEFMNAVTPLVNEQNLEGAKFQIAYHGTPHIFDEFSLSGVGITGEGATAHGWGLYFAQDEAVAKEYRSRLARKSGLPQVYYEGKENKKLAKTLSEYISLKEIGNDADTLSREIAASLVFIRRSSKNKARLIEINKEGAKRIEENPQQSIDEFLKGSPKGHEWFMQGKIYKAKDIAESEGRNVSISDFLKVIEEDISSLAEELKQQETDKETLERIDVEKLTIRPRGALLEVDIPESDVLLDEQKTFGEQPPKVQEAILNIIGDDYDAVLSTAADLSSVFEEELVMIDEEYSEEDIRRFIRDAKNTGLDIDWETAVELHKENEKLYSEQDTMPNTLLERIREILTDGEWDDVLRLEDHLSRRIEEFGDVSRYSNLARYVSKHLSLVYAAKNGLLNELTGEDLYDGISELFVLKDVNTKEMASKALNKHGVKGITYDGRDDGRCFVIFDDKAIEIKRKYDSAIKENKAEIKRTFDEIKAEVKKAFPNAKDMKYEGSDIVVSLPNGAKVRVKVKDKIIVNDKAKDSARQAHGVKDNREVGIQGYWQKVSGSDVDGILAVSKDSEEGTTYHESLHMAMDLALTSQEKKALTDHYTKEAQEKGMDIEETIANGYAEWRVARENGKGTLLGKLFKKMHDFWYRLKAMFTGIENAHNVMRRIESGEVWERKDKGFPQSLVKYSYEDSDVRLKRDEEAFGILVDSYIASNKNTWKQKNDGKLYRVMDMPLVLQMLGAPDMTLSIYGSGFKHILDAAKHPGMDESILKQLPSQLADPVMVFDSNGKYVAVVELKDNNGATITVPVEINKPDSRHGIISVVNSMYGRVDKKDNKTPSYRWFQANLQNNKALYINKKKSTRWAQAIRKEFPVGSTLLNSALSNSSIKTESDLVNIRNQHPTKYSFDFPRYSIRKKPAPKKTVIAYKLFKVKKSHPGKLFPLFVDANKPAEMGVWLDADVGEMNNQGKVKSKLGGLAFRPGWHAGDFPVATHIGKNTGLGTAPAFRNEDQVWAEVEMAADVDWQEEANRRAERNKKGEIVPRTAHITDQIPEDGFYRYKTNPNMTGTWLIGGSMKINRILTDEEVYELNERNGVHDLPRERPFEWEKYGFDEYTGLSSGETNTKKFSVRQLKKEKANSPTVEEAHVAATNNLAKKLFKSLKNKVVGKKNPDVKVEEGQDNLGGGIGLVEYYLASPSKIAEKVPAFKNFFQWAQNAMEKEVKLRSMADRKLSAAFNMAKSKEDTEALINILWEGDATSKEWTKEELLADGVKENVADAYITIRRLMTRFYKYINDARTGKQVTSKTMSEVDAKALEHNDFVTRIISQVKQEDGKVLVTYEAYRHWEKTHNNVTGDMLMRFKDDEAIQVLSVEPVDVNGETLYNVKLRERVGDMHKRTGYIPHFFHNFFVIAKVKDEDGNIVDTVVGSARSQSDAVKQAEEYVEQQKKLGKEVEGMIVRPKQFDFAALGVDEHQLAATVGDREYAKMVKKLETEHDMTLDEAKEIVSSIAKTKGRHRFFGNALQRKGTEGYEKDMKWVLRHFTNSASRYVALETEFKPKAISMYERMFGAFDKDPTSLLAKYIKQYIGDLNGNPTRLEEAISRVIQKTPWLNKIVKDTFGDRYALYLAGQVTGWTSVLKLGFLNASSALLNLSQLINASVLISDNPAVSGMRLAKAMKRLTAGTSLSDRKVLVKTGVLEDIGLDSGSGYDKARPRSLKEFGKSAYGFARGLGDKSMYLFKKTEELVRRSTVLAAYEQARAEGKTDAEAIEFAKEVNRKANFDYGVQDAPNIFRRGSIISQIVLQFKKYGIKEMELMLEMTPFIGKSTNKKQKAAFWNMYILLCAGLWQTPLMGLIDDLISFVTGIMGNKVEPTKEFKAYVYKKIDEDPESKPFWMAVMKGAPFAAGIDLSSRTGMADFFPSVNAQTLLGVSGSTAIRAIGSLWDGDGEAALRAISPSFANAYSAATGEKHGKRGRMMSKYEEMQDRIIRLAGFTSSEEAEEAERAVVDRYVKSVQARKKQEAIDDFLEAEANGDDLKPYLAKLKELGVKPNAVREERKRKRMTQEELKEEKAKNKKPRQQKEPSDRDYLRQ